MANEVFMCNNFMYNDMVPYSSGSCVAITTENDLKKSLFSCNKQSVVWQNKQTENIIILGEESITLKELPT